MLLFGNQTNLAPFDGELYYIKEFYRQSDAERLFNALMADLAWQEESIIIYGKQCKVPRLMCWYGDPEAHYRYSGVDHPPLPWTGELLGIKGKVEAYCQWFFNSVLANLYRDGRDSMGCHADDEEELGKNPVIASLSLGEERVFKLHHKKKKQSLNLMLGHGDLLVMAGSLQHHWLHCLPKARAVKKPRINLTFRRIII
ncbi:MAG: alpha-ketoglutarate-dependent dioxygenase AlkB family protein [Gammaproteobacteria bacterium]